MAASEGEGARAGAGAGAGTVFSGPRIQNLVSSRVEL